MNRKERVNMIVKSLLLPFTRPPFESEDLFVNSAQAYCNLSDSKDLDPGKALRACSQARTALLGMLEREIRPGRLSELSELLEMFYPEDQLALAYKWSGRVSLDEYYVQILLRLSVEFITLRDGAVSIKMWDTPGRNHEFFPISSGLYRVELWSEIARVITPDVLIAGYFVQCGIQDVRYLRNLPDNISLSDSLLARINKKGVAETHLHLSAGMSYLSVWEAVTDPTALRLIQKKNMSLYQKLQQKEQRENRNLLIAGWLRLIMAVYLEKYREEQGSGETYSEKNTDILEFFQRSTERKKNSGMEIALLQYVLGSREDAGKWEILLKMLVERQEICQSVFGDEFVSSEKEDALDILLRGIYAPYRNLGTSGEIILLFSALRHIVKHPQCQGFQRVFLCYLRIKNEYFSNKMQSAGINGLTFFRRYFTNAASAIHKRKAEDKQKSRLAYRAAFLNQLHCTELKKLEVKLSPPRVKHRAQAYTAEYCLAVSSQLYEVLETYRDILRQLQQAENQANAPTLGLVYHFIRSDMLRASSGMCWAANTAEGPQDIVSETRQKCEGFVKALQYLLREVPYLANYVVGLDVASEEVVAEPWVYAPVYRFARNRNNTYPVQLESGMRVPNIGFTYHVGEDFHHVMSGLRHVDEVLTYFGYKPGDRLGHGLVLQIDIAEWVHNNEIVSLPVMEHLENLLWLWSLCTKDLPQLSGELPRLEREIMALAEKIYGNTKGITPYVLWKAYVRKFEQLDTPFCEDMEKRYLHEKDQYGRRSPQVQPDVQRSFCARVRQMDETEELCSLPYVDAVWDSDKLLLTHYCPVYARVYRSAYFTSNNVAQTSMFQLVQSHMKNKVQNMGVFVETNPTSNMLIGDISGLINYPIATLNGVGEQSTTSVLLSINSDDPLVFNTNIENELALVYHTLTYQNVSRELVLQWIDKVRQYGLDSSFIREEKSTDVQIRELGEILDGLHRLRDDIIQNYN